MNSVLKPIKKVNLLIKFATDNIMGAFYQESDRDNQKKSRENLKENASDLNS